MQTGRWSLQFCREGGCSRPAQMNSSDSVEEEERQGNPQNDTWIFALTLLLSSTLVYNSIGTIDQNAMNQLHYVAELTELIQAKAPSMVNKEQLDDSAEFVCFFPNFIWALRDFTLLLELDGHPITEDEYLENALKLKKGDSQDIKLFNLPRKCLRMFFPTRKCFIFERPTSRKNLPRLGEMKESELDPDFVEQAAQFCSYIYGTSKAKTIPGGHVLNGRLLAMLAETYVDTLRSGKVPCIENAVLALAEIENSAAVADATARYVELMEQRLKLPTETLEELLEIHAGCEEEALRVFMARAFKDDTRQFQVELKQTLAEKKEDYCFKNEEASSERCWALLRSLSQELEGNIRKGTYSQPGSHERFLNDLDKVEESYHQTPNKGVMAKAVLQQFLQGKESVGKSILLSDEALEKKEKDIAEAKAQAKAAELQLELQKQQEAVLQEKLLDEQRSHNMHIKELQEKMESERKTLLEEQQKMMDSKLREQEAFLKEGFQEEADQLQKELRQLQKENEERKAPSWFGTALGAIVDLGSLLLPSKGRRHVRKLSDKLRKW
ncbi:guanylate-binding protein 1-like isoform X2 [Varanus komodoensis]|uniref:guanylate-binding protein 1-like isoform X2 n=1 Tax=Varanus komodoensis TaxID=61221 RepID=UPI001CF77335|nr:guanylate-binding protein 1-like isoform X2 [Varanus komodoensis]